MTFQELINTSLKEDLVLEIKNTDLNSYSNNELINLSMWINVQKHKADHLTLEDELVGYTYDNLSVLTPKVEKEELRRGICLIKTMKFK